MRSTRHETMQGNTNNAHAELKSRWQNIMSKGQSAHKAGDFNKAVHYFSEAVALAEELEHKSHKDDPLSMQFVASHNLSACFSAQGGMQQALNVLRDIHYKLLNICKSRSSARDHRIAALGVLDNSLFSLSSHLGALAQVDEMYQVIRETEQIVSLAGARLWH